MTGFRRMPSGGRIERTKPLSFTYNGKQYSGIGGDTIASALLANGHTIIGRSFKYHRPRGFLSAGLEEPNGLFTLGEGAATIPNVIGTITALVAGMQIKSQNAWPSPRFDLMAINSLAAPLFKAGFYYKTFMGPTKGSWMFFEPFIRRAAGLGKATEEKGLERYDTTNGFCDVLVIGAGPAGLAAALTAGRAGARVVLTEQDREIGGSLLSSRLPVHEAWRRSVEDELEALENVRILNNSTAQGIYDHNQVVVSIGSRKLEVLQAKTIIHATGAFERPLLFNNNDRPGVMLAGALRSYLNRHALAPKQRAVIVTNNDSAYTSAFDLAEADVAVTVAECRSQPNGDLLARAAQLGIAVFPNSGIADVVGDRQLHAVKLGGRHGVTIECDALGMSGGWNPAVHLTSHGDIKPIYNEAVTSFVPGGFASGQYGAGAVLGHFGLLQSIRDGVAAAEQAVVKVGLKLAKRKLEEPVVREDRAYSISAKWILNQNDKKAFIDFQNDVTLADVKQAHQEGSAECDLSSGHIVPVRPDPEIHHQKGEHHRRVADDQARRAEADLVVELEGNEHHRRHDGAGNESEGQHDLPHDDSRVVEDGRF